MPNTAIQNEDLRNDLSSRRREMQDDVQRRIHDGRTDRLRLNEVCDDVEHSDTDSQGEIEMALLQMRVETLTNLDAAIVRLDAGAYGSCVECAGEISARRLEVLPFAIRCRDCEEGREEEQRRARASAQRRDSRSFVPVAG